MIDELDRSIVLLLQDNGRASNTELARKLGVSESTVRRRVGQLIRSGVIQVTAIPNQASLGFKTEAFIGLEVQMGSVDSVAEQLSRIASVHYVGACTGRFDLFIWVSFPSQEELGDFLRSQLSAIAGVRRSETFVILGVEKRTYGWLYEPPKSKRGSKS